MNSNSTQIHKLREKIYTTLDPLIQNDYCLLDIPDHKNIGDNLIWAGELKYLERLPYKMLYTANLHLCQINNIPTNSIILLHGGGNFGDIWRVVQDFRNNIIRQFNKNRIIIFPQTVHYDDKFFLEKDSQIFNQHPDLTICTRDYKSYEILTSYFTNAKIHLLPDMAFCLNYDEKIISKITNKILILERKDKELNNNVNLLKLVDSTLNKKQVEIKDWPTFNLDKWEELKESIYNKIDSKLSKSFINTPLIKKFIDHRYGIKNRYTMERYISQGIEFINEYDEIYTTRLHGLILSILLDKKVHIIDNYYGKNSSFYDAWLGDFKNIDLIATSRSN